jgi:predicted TIM-barrel fold metal-dependent hydrolase
MTLMASKSASGGMFFSPCSCCQPGFAAMGVGVGVDTGRRTFLAGGVASGIAAVGLGMSPARSQAPAAAKTRIDVHHHYVPPVHADIMATKRSGGRPPQWTPQMSLDEMDKSGIATAIVSLVQPGAWFDDDVPLSRRLARDCNEYGAKMVQDHPGRFGLFAAIAPPDPEGSLKEIEYVFDTLKADGVGLFTSYGDKYLGDPSFEPVYAELNRRKAIVYVHPTTPNCCGKIVPGIGPSTIEFATDTTRTITHIVFSGVATKFPDIRWIFSHAGGTLPFLTARLEIIAQQKKMAGGAAPILRKFYYELAQGNTPGQLAALLKMAPISQVLYGTDYPFRDGAEVNAGIAAYGFTPDDVRSIEREIAFKLIPRLKPA